MVLSPYNPEWPEKFEQIKSILLDKLSGMVFRIEHVGSTSVKDLAAKSVIDMDIVIPENVPLNIIIEKLSELGYKHEGDLGIAGREAFKQNPESEFYNSFLAGIRHNLYACHEDNLELEKHILFRDYLRANPVARLAYEKLKQDIAANSEEDVKIYVKTKETAAEDFVNSIVEEGRKIQRS